MYANNATINTEFWVNANQLIVIYMQFSGAHIFLYIRRVVYQFLPETNAQIVTLKALYTSS